jgi:hypothetical protein
MDRMRPYSVALAVLLCVLAAGTVQGATWQYQGPFEASKGGKDGAHVLLWLPPQTKTTRGLLVGGRLGIELEIALDPEVRKACAESDVGIVYFSPHISGVFHYWGDGNTDTKRWLKAFDDLAQRSGHPELRRVPWITMGHSTAGIFCRNVAYWQPERVAGIIHIKSGNFHQKDHLPPTGNLVGVPLVAINGQLETFGPAAGIQPELGRETQWTYVRKDIEKFREQNPNHLMSMWLDLGGDHFHGSPELSKYAALFIRKTAKYRIPAQLPPGDAAIPCLPLKIEDGWLTDPDLYGAKHPPAAFKDYTGDKRQAMWHYDEETAKANVRHHRTIGKHQCLSNPVGKWLDEGDGWTFQVKADWLDVMPQNYGGSVGGKQVGHAATPFLYRCKINEPVAQVGPDKFRLLRPVAKTVNFAAVHPGDEQYRATNRWGSLAMPAIKGEKQSIDFPAVGDLRADSGPVELKGKASSSLPLYYEVDYGPVVVKDGKIEVSELPTNAQLPIECKVTAYQIGRRTGSPVAPAAPVAQVFKVLKP